MEERDVNRLAAFTDGIIVVAMTLLVLDIHLPRPAGNVSDAQLLQMLKEIAPKYFGYALSFLVVGMFWMSHVRKFRRFARVDGGTIWLTLFFLLTIGLIPFVTSVLSENPGPLGTTVYAATMATASFCLFLLGWHAWSKGLHLEAATEAEQWRSQTRSLLSFGLFAGSIAVAQINPDVAKLFWIAQIPVAMALETFWRRKDKRAPPTPRIPPGP